jgi:hypothetical protein
MSFGVLLIAVDEYPDPPGPLPSSESVARLSRVVTGDYGGVVVGSIVARSREDVLKAFDRWIARDERSPRSTIVYLVGHGTDDGDEHAFIAPGDAATTELPTGTLSGYFEKDWLLRPRLLRLGHRGEEPATRPDARAHEDAATILTMAGDADWGFA